MLAPRKSEALQIATPTQAAALPVILKVQRFLRAAATALALVQESNVLARPTEALPTLHAKLQLLLPLPAMESIPPRPAAADITMTPHIQIRIS
jgi:hypothetical protein